MQTLKTVTPVASRQAPSLSLGHAPKGFKGSIISVCASEMAGVSGHELESRLLELGFVEGARIEILHQGGLRKDPIAVRVNNNTVALRRVVAMAVLVA